MYDRTLILPDDRSLAFTDIGDPEGPVVVYFHGAPSSRLDLVADDAVFTELGVRVVAFDRPGYGGSSPRPSRSREDVVTDVVELADHLGIDRFAVVGMSSGGPYAVACGALAADRVGAIGVVAGVTDLAWPTAIVDYSDDVDTSIMRAEDEADAIQLCTAAYGGDGSKFFGRDLDLAPADMELLGDEAQGSQLFASLSEAFRQGVVGFAQDIFVEASPWPFDTSGIDARTIVLHGEADTVVPIAHGRHTADVIPGAELRAFPDHGHLSIMREIPALAADLIVHL